mmetsp:Transcript_29897/g.72792  ORF Transcript_29897/g.72792 Transcript_29897/m.72792 type:complete len:224 (-) Transcript_29897:175-846(-)
MSHAWRERGEPSGLRKGGSRLPQFHVPTKTRSGWYSGRSGMGIRPSMSFSMSSFQAYSCCSDGKPSCHTAPALELEQHETRRCVFGVWLSHIVAAAPARPCARGSIFPLPAFTEERLVPKSSEKACTAPAIDESAYVSCRMRILERLGLPSKYPSTSITSRRSTRESSRQKIGIAPEVLATLPSSMLRFKRRDEEWCCIRAMLDNRRMVFWWLGGIGRLVPSV